MPQLYTLYRTDLANQAVDTPNLTEINLSAFPIATTTRYTIDRVDIELSPVAWNDIEITRPEFDPAAPAS